MSIALLGILLWVLLGILLETLTAPLLNVPPLRMLSMDNVGGRRL